ncbi:YcdB/YcdC domain-containing protein [Phosphitispora sp. TUW77]|uniref:YcdB/YcdC domain-containing protein n=1 Tax=Phosphitispora sp. TUW77 TaxID=3152361 RepID=UPI003AB7256A
MKKAFKLSLVIFLITTLLFPAYSFAQYDRELEQAIEMAKSVFEVSDAYDNFSYNMHKQGDRTVFDLMWSDENNKMGSINVSIDTLGRIISYYSYTPNQEINRPKLPAISKEEARQKAEDFIRKINSVPFEKLQYQNEEQRQNIYDTAYNMKYIRIENGVPYFNNSVNVSVNNLTGKVESYNCFWNYDLEFCDPNDIITLEDAKKIYVQELGLKLQYKLKYEQDDCNPYLVYTNVYINHSIDAGTGEIVVTDPYYRFYNGIEASAKMLDSSIQGYGPEKQVISLTPQEREAIESAAGIMSEDKAEAAARKAINIGNEYQLTDINLYKSWINKQDFLWTMSFNKGKANEDVVKDESYYVTIDGKTGELLNFYKSQYLEKERQPVYNEKQSLKIATDYIKTVQPQWYLETEYVTWNRQYNQPVTETEPRQYYFAFERKTNGANFPDNGFNVTVDAVTGSIISYSFNWYKGELPETEGIISIADANAILLEKAGLQLQYIPYNNDQDTVVAILPPPYEGIEKSVRLVYALNSGIPANIDPYNGNILDYNGELYNSNEVLQYIDISGHYAESKIKDLAVFGIMLPGEEFKPDKNIIQREFLYLLQKTVNSYYPYKPDKEHDKELYSILINSGIVREGEQTPDSFITRQDAVKFIIRALNYSKVAEIDKNIFSVPFKDAEKIDRQLLGHVAIAYGLNIVQGNNGYFNPAALLTRGQAAVVIHNFLNSR